MNNQIASNPVYPTKHSGTALVVGSAPNAIEDMTIAIKRLTQEPYVIAVNAMVDIISCEAVVTCHPEGAGQIVHNWSRVCEAPIAHHYPSDQREPTKAAPGISHVWRGPHAGSGSASLCAVLVAKAIGFSNIILCGVPLEKIGYIDGYTGSYKSEFHVNGKVINATILQRHKVWGDFFKDGMLDGVTSFSGFTADLLGEPDFNEMELN